jgi:hypothetical protein
MPEGCHAGAPAAKEEDAAKARGAIEEIAKN